MHMASLNFESQCGFTTIVPSSFGGRSNAYLTPVQSEHSKVRTNVRSPMDGPMSVGAKQNDVRASLDIPSGVSHTFPLVIQSICIDCLERTLHTTAGEDFASLSLLGHSIPPEMTKWSEVNLTRDFKVQSPMRGEMCR